MGNVYVVQPDINRISRISPEHLVSTFAGWQQGSDDGIGTGARFWFPFEPAIDQMGNLYVADSYNQAIRKITPDAVVTTLAGLPGRTGNADGYGQEARFYDPRCIAIDSSGNLIVGEVSNRDIRKVSPEGLVTTLAGTPLIGDGEDDTGTMAHFSQPMGLAIDVAGNIYVADRGAATIRRIDTQSFVTTLGGYPSSWGSAEGTGSQARFQNPTGIAVDSSGNIYVSDPPAATVYKGIPATVVEPPTRVGSSEVRLRFNTTRYTTYSILASTKLSDWASIGIVVGTGQTATFVDTKAAVPQRFYRVQP